MISDFTRDICKRLCVEKGLEMEISRLDRKLEIIRERALTSAEQVEDNAGRMEAERLFKIGGLLPRGSGVSR